MRSRGSASPPSGRTAVGAALPEVSSGGARVSPWVKALVLLHLVGIVAWALPRPRAAILQDGARPVGSDYVLVLGDRLRRIEPISAYAQVTGTWQYWDMFAPDPAQTDQWADARVELRDGTSTIVGYPRMYALSIPEKYLQERYRKFYERAGSQDHAYLWPIFAVQLAREASYDPKNPPVAVTLRRHLLRIVPPGQPQATEYTNEAYYRYILLPGDLEQSRR